MTKELFEIDFCWSWKPSISVEIECDPSATRGSKLGVAAVAAIKTDADLSEADLRDAVLRGADLRGAILSGAILIGADLRGAVLRDAVLRGADLRGAILSGAILIGADLRDAVLRGADLREADLTGADLRNADLRRAVLWNAMGNGTHIRTIQTDLWAVVYTSEVIQIGCEQHSIADWWGFDDERVDAMDRSALEWWQRWKPILKQIIETAPAVPTTESDHV